MTFGYLLDIYDVLLLRSLLSRILASHVAAAVTVLCTLDSWAAGRFGMQMLMSATYGLFC